MALQPGDNAPDVTLPSTDKQQVALFDVEDFYFLARASLVKDERLIDGRNPFAGALVANLSPRLAEELQMPHRLEPFAFGRSSPQLTASICESFAPTSFSAFSTLTGKPSRRKTTNEWPAADPTARTRSGRTPGRAARSHLRPFPEAERRTPHPPAVFRMRVQPHLSPLRVACMGRAPGIGEVSCSGRG